MRKIITVGREFGSGGRELARRLAENLGIEYYDRQIITDIAEHTELSEEYVRQIIDKTPHHLYPITVGRTISYIDDYMFEKVQSVYQAQSEIICNLAEKSDCVIVGRCADYILKDYKPFRVFVYADLQSRINRCLNRNGNTHTEKEIKKMIKQIDKNRASYYSYYVGEKWGDKLNYDLCINTTDLVIKDIVPMVARIFKDE